MIYKTKISKDGFIHWNWESEDEISLQTYIHQYASSYKNVL